MTIQPRRFAVTAAIAVLLAVTAACGSSDGASRNVAAPEDCTPAHDMDTIEKGTLRVAAAEGPPVVSTANNSFVGLEPILIKKFAEENCLALEVVPTSFAGIIPAVQSERVDLASGAFYRTAERMKIVDMTGPVWLDQLAIISKEEIDEISDLEGKKVGTVDGYLWVADLHKVLGSDLVKYPSNVEMLADLKAGRIMAGIDSTATASAYSGFQATAAQPDTRVKSSVEPAQVGFPYTKGNTALGSALEEAIAQWHRDGTIDAALTEVGLPADLSQVGEPRIIE